MLVCQVRSSRGLKQLQIKWSGGWGTPDNGPSSCHCLQWICGLAGRAKARDNSRDNTANHHSNQDSQAELWWWKAEILIYGWLSFNYSMSFHVPGRDTFIIFSVCSWNNVLWHKIQTQMYPRSDLLNLPKGKIIMTVPREVLICQM